MNYTFELKELQATHIVSSSSRRYKLDPKLYQKAFMQWAGPKGLINGPANKLISAYQHEGKELSVDIGLTVPQEVEGESEISKGLLSGGLYAIGHFEIERMKYPPHGADVHAYIQTPMQTLCGQIIRDLSKIPSVNITR